MRRTVLLFLVMAAALVLAGGVALAEVFDGDDDRLVGTDGRDTLRGFGGDDLIRGLDGRDRIYGGDGAFGADGDDTMYGGGGGPSILVREHREGVERYCEHLTGIAAILDGWI